MSTDIDELIESLNEKNDKCRFTIETDQEGVLEFDNFMAWREEALLNKVNDIENLSAENFAKILMTFLLLKYKDITIDYDSYNSNKLIFENINLKLNKEDTIKFSEKFLSIHEYLLYEPYSETKKNTEKLDGPAFLERAQKNKKPYFEFPEDPLQKLKQAFVLHYKRQRELSERILGLKIQKNFSSLVNIVNQQKKINKIFDSTKPLADTKHKMDKTINPILGYKNNLKKAELTKVSPTNRKNNSINELFEKEAKNKAKINNSIIRTPELLEIIIKNQNTIENNIVLKLDLLMELQKEISENNNLQLKTSNEILQDQLNIAKDNIKSSDSKANIALIISVVSMLISLFLGVYQIVDSNKTSLKNFEKYDSIKNAILDGNKIHKDERDTTEEILLKLINENENLKNKVNKLENKKS